MQYEKRTQDDELISLARFLRERPDLTLEDVQDACDEGKIKPFLASGRLLLSTAKRLNVKDGFVFKRRDIKACFPVEQIKDEDVGQLHGEIAKLKEENAALRKQLGADAVAEPLQYDTTNDLLWGIPKYIIRRRNEGATCQEVAKELMRKG